MFYGSMFDLLGRQPKALKRLINTLHHASSGLDAEAATAAAAQSTT
jgi:hypothetical protein